MGINPQFQRGRRALRISPVWLQALFFTTGTALAASDLDFYERLLTRGIAHFGEGNYLAATSELRIAAFGLGEVLDEFETAHVYLAISASRLHNDADARGAVMRVIAAQRIQSRYAALELPAPLRQEFDGIAAATLTAVQRNELHRPATGPTRIPPNGPAAASPVTPAPVPKSLPIEVIAPPQSQPIRPTAPAVVVPRASPMPQPSAPQPIPQRSMPVPQPMPQPMPQRAQPLPTSVPMKPKPSPNPVPVPAPPSTKSSSAATSSTRTMPETRPADAGTRSTQPPRTAPMPRSVAPALPPAAVPPPVSASVKTKEVPLPQPRPSAPSPRDAGNAIDAIRVVAEGQRALDDGDLARARERYRSALAASSLPHEAALKVGEGLYRTHDFDGAVRAFQRAGTLVRSEAQFQYYLAVSLFEIGKYADAKRELTAALPNIEVTPEVARYRTKIEGFAH